MFGDLTLFIEINFLISSRSSVLNSVSLSDYLQQHTTTPSREIFWENNQGKPSFLLHVA